MLQFFAYVCGLQMAYVCGLQMAYVCGLQMAYVCGCNWLMFFAFCYIFYA